MSGGASLDSSTAFTERACEALQTAQRQLDWLSLALEPRLYGHREFHARLRAFLLRHHRVRVRLLLIEPMRVLPQAGQGIDFIRSMSSRVEIRTASPELAVAHEEWMILTRGAGCKPRHRRHVVGSTRPARPRSGPGSGCSTNGGKWRHRRPHSGACTSETPPAQFSGAMRSNAMIRSRIGPGTGIARFSA